MKEEDMDILESEEDDQEEVIREESLRRNTKTPSRRVQKNHPEEQIIRSARSSNKKTNYVSDKGSLLVTS